MVNGRASPGRLVGEYYESPEYNMARVRTDLTIRVYGRYGGAVEEVVKTNVLPTPLWPRALITYAVAYGARGRED